MKLVERFVYVIAALVLLFVIHQLVGILMRSHGWEGLKPADWASWVQAVGSIFALGVAIFVMSRQNAHAANMIAHQDRLTTRRKAVSVHLLVDKAMAHAVEIVDQIHTYSIPQESAALHKYMQWKAPVVADVILLLKAIPIHDLGSYDMAGGLLNVIKGCEDLQKNYRPVARNTSGQRFCPWPAHARDEQNTHQARRTHFPVWYERTEIHGHVTSFQTLEGKCPVAAASQVRDALQLVAALAVRG